MNSETHNQVSKHLNERKAFKMEYIDQKGKKTVRIVAPHMIGKCGGSDKALCYHVEGESSGKSQYDPKNYKTAYRHFTISQITILETIDKDYPPLVGYFEYWEPSFSDIDEHVPEPVEHQEMEDVAHS